MLRRLVFALLTLGLLATPVRAEAGEITQVQVTVPGGQPLALSPDGRWLVVARGGSDGQELCRMDTALLVPQDCAPVPMVAIAPESVRWSPAGDLVAFTEDWFTYGDETDIWLYEPATASARNLTDDQQGRPGIGKPGAPSDRSPAWTPDGTALLFVRSIADGAGGWTAALMQLPAAGGTPAELGPIAPVANPVLAGLQAMADGRILFTIAGDGVGESGGLWSFGQCGGAPQRLLDLAGSGLATPVIVGVSPTGRVLLTDIGEQPDIMVYDAASGAVTPVGDADGRRTTTAATFSPDGGWLLSVRFGGSPTGALVLTDLATGAEQELGNLARPLGDHPLAAGLAWAIDGRLFAAGFGRSGELIDAGLPIVLSIHDLDGSVTCGD